MNGAESLNEQGEFILRNGLMLKKGTSLHIEPNGIYDLINLIKRQYKQSISGMSQKLLDVFSKAAELHKELEKNEEVDALFSQAVDVVFETGQASVSMLQRRLKLGYSRAVSLIDLMEKREIVSPFQGSNPRKILVTRQQWIDLKAQKAKEPNNTIVSNAPAETDVMDSQRFLNSIDMNNELWEFILLRELINKGIGDLAALKNRLFKDFSATSTATNISVLDSTDYILRKTSELKGIVAPLKSTLENELVDALGEPGMPGDAGKIITATDKIVCVYRDIIKWGLEFHSVPIHADTKNLLLEVKKMCLSPISGIEKMSNDIIQQVRMIEAGTSENFEINAVLEEPDITGFMNELEKVRRMYNVR